MLSVKFRCLPAQVTQDEAIKMFSRRMKQFRHGKFLLPTRFFIPYFLFRIETRNAGKTATEFFAIDATTGTLDLYQFDAIPDDLTGLEEVETTQYGATLLTENEALAMIQERLQRRIFQTKGFFKIDDFHLAGTFIETFYLPYWVGLYEKKQRVAIEIIDAVRGQFEGGKIHDLVREWLQAESHHRTT
ncbi:MAG: hypothetical protein U0Y68_24860 [Blastocatellia bacterium]